MLVVISYDIASDARRNRVSKVLEDHGQRVQLSVFEVRLDERRLQRLRVELEKIIDPLADSLRWYRLCERCRGAVVVDGLGPRGDGEEDVVIV